MFDQNFRMGEKQQQSWFQEYKENFLQKVADNPLKFTFWAMTIGVCALHVLQHYFIPLEDMLIEKMSGITPDHTSHAIYGSHSVMRGPGVAGFDGSSFFDGEYGGHSVMRGDDVAGFDGHSMFENR